MSVRRLADDADPTRRLRVLRREPGVGREVIARYPAGRQQSAVIPLLWRAQEQEGWVTRAAIEAVAKMLGMAYIRVLEVATFYTQFLLKPVGTQGPYHRLRHDALHAARRRRPDRRLPAQDRARSARVSTPTAS